MRYEPMRDADRPNELSDELYPFQSGYDSRGSPMPYVIGVFALAILAVLTVSIVSVDKQNMLTQENQATNEAVGTQRTVGVN